MATDHCGGDHGARNGHYQRFLRGRDPGECRLAQRGAATSSVFFSRIIGQSFGSAVFGGIFNSGLASRSINGNEFVQLLQEGHEKVDNIPGIQAILDALAHALHDIYLLSGLIAVLVLAAALTFPASLRLLGER